MTSFVHGKRSLHVAGLGHGNTPIPMGARVGNLLCSSGINGADAATGKLPEDPLAQVKHAFANLKSLLAAGGATLGDVVKLTVYLKDGPGQKAMREAINVEWIACFPDADDRPLRRLAVRVCAIVVGLLLFYVLMSGPARVLKAHTRNYRVFWDEAYTPLIPVARSTHTMPLLVEYLNWWEKLTPDPFVWGEDDFW